MKSANGHFPTTLKDAVTKFLTRLSSVSQQSLRDAVGEQMELVIELYGKTIQDLCGLRDGNQALLRACKTRSPDQATLVILRAARRRLRQKTQSRKEG